MKTVYLNFRGPCGVETIGEVRRQDFNSFSEFQKEIIRLKQEYNLSGFSVYTSQRCTKEYRD